MKYRDFYRFFAVSLLIATTSSLPNSVYALEWSDLDPTNSDSAVLDAATEVDPTNPDAFINQGIPGEINPLNPDSAINDGLTELDPTAPNSAVREGVSELDPTAPNSAVREGVSELDPTDPNSAMGEVVDSVNPVSAIGRSTNDQLSTAGQNFQNGFIEPTKQLLLFAGGGILFLMVVFTILSKLKGKKS